MDLAPTPPPTQPTLAHIAPEAAAAPPSAHLPADDVALARMQAEHTEAADAYIHFDSPELSEPTFPACEYWFVADPTLGLRTLGLREWPGTFVSLHRQAKKAAPPGGGGPGAAATTAAATAAGGGGASAAAAAAASRALARKPRTWKALEPYCAQVNERLGRRGLGPLTHAERVAARLHTGPMALKYNALLRFAIAPSAASQAACDELCLRNGYGTTLAALNSALRRLASLASATAPVYRCLSAREAADTWRLAATSTLTCAAGALACVADRPSALAAAAHNAARPTRRRPPRRPPPRGGGGGGGSGGGGVAAAGRAARGRDQFWSSYRTLTRGLGAGFDALMREEGGGSGVSDGEEEEEGGEKGGGGGGRSAASMPAGRVDRSSELGGRDGASLLRIDPCGARMTADLNFLSQAPTDGGRDTFLVPLTPIQLTSYHIEGSILVVNAVGGREATRAALAPLPVARPPPLDRSPNPLPKEPPRPQLGADAGADVEAPTAAATSAAAAAALPSAPTDDDEEEGAAGSAWSGVLHMTGSFDARVGGGGGGGGGGVATAPPLSLHRPANPLRDKIYVGCPWAATASGRDGHCYFWFHLPEATGGVEMRHRRGGERDWTAHEQSVQVLPGGWWRTGEWPYAGDTDREQGVWVDGTCVMAGIFGPDAPSIGAELPPGTSPPSPHGIGSTGAVMVRVENGRIVATTGAVGTGAAVAVGATVARQEALETIFARTPERYGRTPGVSGAGDAGTAPPASHRSTVGRSGGGGGGGGVGVAAQSSAAVAVGRDAAEGHAVGADTPVRVRAEAAARERPRATTSRWPTVVVGGRWGRRSVPRRLAQPLAAAAAAAASSGTATASPSGRRGGAARDGRGRAAAHVPPAVERRRERRRRADASRRRPPVTRMGGTA